MEELQHEEGTASFSSAHCRKKKDKPMRTPRQAKPSLRCAHRRESGTKKISEPTTESLTPELFEVRNRSFRLGTGGE